MSLPLDELFAEETRDNVLDDLLTTCRLVGLKVTAWQSGQPFRTALVVSAQKIADLTRLQSLAIKGGFLDYAEAGWLTILAESVYRVVRRPAQYSTGDSFRVTNASDEVYTRLAGEITVAHNVTGKTFHNASDVTVAPSTTVEDLVFVADEVGTDSDGGPNSIDQLVSVAAGITITNDKAVLGSNEESDPDLRVRCRNKLGALSPNGPKEAYAFVATTPYFDNDPDRPCCVVSVPTTRVQVVLDKDTGRVTVYCATENGSISEPDRVVTDAALDRWATPWLVDQRAELCTEDTTDVTYHIWLGDSNLTTEQVEARIATALSRYFKTLPIGGFIIPPDAGFIYVDAIRTVITRAVEGVIKVTVSLPTGDIEMGPGHVAILGTVTPTVTVVT